MIVVPGSPLRVAPLSTPAVWLLFQIAPLLTNEPAGVNAAPSTEYANVRP